MGDGFVILKVILYVVLKRYCMRGTFGEYLIWRFDEE